MERLLRWAEGRVRPTEADPGASPPGGEGARGLARFYWHFLRQVRGRVALLFAAGFAIALCDAMIPVVIGRAVSLATSLGPARFWSAWPQLLGMAAVVGVARPLALMSQVLLSNQALSSNLVNLIRWQSHFHVVRQSWSFFQNDFAGRVANRVMQAGGSVRDSVISASNAVWYILIYGGTALVVLAAHGPLLAVPVLVWFAGYVLLLRAFIPRLLKRSRVNSEVRSALTGRIVDSYTNILTVKLFARAEDEDRFVRDGVDAQSEAYMALMRTHTRLSACLAALNATMVVTLGGLSLWLWSRGQVGLGTVATALPLGWQLASISGWVSFNVTMIFEQFGVVQDGMHSIAQPRQMPDAPGATRLTVPEGRVRFEGVRFGYGTARGVLHGLDLEIAPGERIGLVGRSGAGKSTLVNLLLGFYRPEAGRILIDGQDIAGVTQESLRGRIAMVTQDTSLLHRSVRDNIAYGRPTASEADIIEAASQAEALAFIEGLEDWTGRRGLEAHVGERGVKLSGGQRQRIAIARVILKAAPILVLDEATSALDSEVEAAIQGQLDTLMQGRTVIAIAHRLSTIARMDRLVVLDEGRVVEQGTHEALLAAEGVYAGLWARQSGGFIDRAGAGQTSGSLDLRYGVR